MWDVFLFFCVCNPLFLYTRVFQFLCSEIMVFLVFIFFRDCSNSAIVRVCLERNFSQQLQHCNALPNAINCFAFFFVFFLHLFLCLRSFLLFYIYFQFFCIFILLYFILFEFTKTEKIKCELGSKIITVDSKFSMDSQAWPTDNNYADSTLI